MPPDRYLPNEQPLHECALQDGCVLPELAKPEHAKMLITIDPTTRCRAGRKGPVAGPQSASGAVRACPDPAALSDLVVRLLR